MDKNYLDREIIGVKNVQDIKECFLAIRIEKEMKNDFAKLCKAYGTTPSDTLRRYIVMCLHTKQL